MAGLLHHNHGVLFVDHTVDADQAVLRPQHPWSAQRLTDAGYNTACFGKWHVERSNELSRLGWQQQGALSERPDWNGEKAQSSLQTRSW